MTSAPCRDCRASIWWATHYRSGNRMPFDAEPFAREDVTPAGCWYLVLNERGDGLIASPAAHTDLAVFERTGIDPARVYVAHFATCPGPLGKADPDRLEPALRERRESYQRPDMAAPVRR